MPEEQPAEVKESAKTPGKKNMGLIIGIVAAAVIILAAGGYYFQTHRSVFIKTDDGGTVKYTQDGNSATATDENGNKISVGENVKIPSNFPKTVPLYPGVTYTLANVNADGSAAYSGTTKDNVATIIAWFKAHMAENGWTKVDIETPTGVNISNNDWVLGVSAITTNGTTALTVSTLTKASIPVSNADGSASNYDEVTAQQQELLNQLNSGQ